MISRILICFAIGLITVCLLCDGMLQLPIFREFVKTSLKEALEEKTGYQVEIGALYLSPFLSLKGDSITIKEKEKPLITAEKGFFTINLWKLLSKKELHIPFFHLERVKCYRDGVENRIAQDIQGSFSYADAQGHLMIKQLLDLHFDCNALSGYLQASWGTFKIDGTFFWLPNGTITHSQVFFKMGESQTFSCHLEGNFLSQDITFSVEGEKFAWGEILLEQPSLQLSMKEGMGTMKLAFHQDKGRHQFSGKLVWKNNPSFQFQTDLSHISRLLGWDLPQAKGNLFLNLGASERGFVLKGELVDGVVESFELGTVFSSIHAVIEGDQKRVRLKRITLRDDEGGLYKGSGSISLNQKKRFPFSVGLSLHRGVFFHSDYAKMAFDGELSFAGTLDKALLKGDLKATSTHITLPKRLPKPVDAVEVTYINLSEEEPEPTRPIKRFANWPLALDIALTIPENGVIKGKHLHSLWKGKVEIGGTVAKPLAKGEFKLQNGSYLFRGKTCELKEGTIALSGDPEKQTTLYLVAQLELENVHVNAVVKGPLLNTSLVLQSTPPMSQRAILAKILFNKKVDEMSSLEETQLTRSLKSLTENGDEKPDLLTRVAKLLKVDRVEIEGDSKGERGDVALRVGKHLSDNTYISISSDLAPAREKGGKGDGEKRGRSEKRGGSLRLEQRFGKRVKFRAEADSASNGRLNLLWSKDY